MKRDKVQSLIVPRFKELTVKKIWTHIKDFSEYKVYFPDFSEDKLPERDYLIAIISTLNPDATKSIIKEAREKRSTIENEDEGNLVVITMELKHLIREIAPQKSNLFLL